jgi:hypothetical protein
MTDNRTKAIVALVDRAHELLDEMPAREAIAALVSEGHGSFVAGEAIGQAISELRTCDGQGR